MKQILIAGIAMLLTSASLPQQQGPPKPPPPEKRWEKDSEKISKAISLTPDELAKMKEIFMQFYKEMDTLHEKNKNQRPSKADVEKIEGKRNEALKKILSKEKYNQFMKVEKELGPPRPKRQGVEALRTLK